MKAQADEENFTPRTQQWGLCVDDLNAGVQRHIGQVAPEKVAPNGRDGVVTEPLDAQAAVEQGAADEQRLTCSVRSRQAWGKLGSSNRAIRAAGGQ